MTDAFFGLIVFKLFILLVIVLNYGSIITLAEAYVVPANATGYHVTVRSAALPISSISATRHVPKDADVQQPSVNDDTNAVVSLVEAPVEVIGPRVVETAMREKVETKRESGIGTGTSTKDSMGYDSAGNHACVLTDDGELKESSYKVYNGKPVRGSAKRDARSGYKRADEEYDNDQESNGSKIPNDEDEDDDEEEYDDDDNLVQDDDKMRRNIRRKGNRREIDPKVWDQWGGWSCCSATCDTGKYTRWRHCVAGSCVSGEKEAQMKSCKLKRCS